MSDQSSLYEVNGAQGEIVRLPEDEFIQIEPQNENVSVLWSSDEALLDVIDRIVAETHDKSSSLAVSYDATTHKDVIEALNTFRERLSVESSDEVTYATIAFKKFVFAWIKQFDKFEDSRKSHSQLGLTLPQGTAVEASILEATGSTFVKKFAESVLARSVVLNN